MDPRGRKMVSYADITPDVPEEPASSAPVVSAVASDSRPVKRPRTSDTPEAGPSAVPGSFAGKAANGHTQPQSQQHKKQKKDPKTWQTSRTLTHNEIWDDSALVEAWDAAMEEYRAVNGSAKGWMDQPEKGSALSWWNTQPEEEAYAEADEEEEFADVAAEEDVEDQLAAATAPKASSTPALANGYAAQPSGPPSIPFPSSSAGAMAALPEDPEKVLGLAVQSYYWAGYLMGRRDEMLRVRAGAPSAAPPQQVAEEIPEGLEEEQEQEEYADMDEAE